MPNNASHKPRAGALVAQLATARTPALASTVVLIAVASPHAMPPVAPMPSSALLERALRHGALPAATVAVGGGFHDWQVPVRAALDPVLLYGAAEQVSGHSLRRLA